VDSRGVNFQRQLDNRYRFLKQLLKASDARSSALAFPDRVHRAGNDAYLEYSNIGKPLSAYRKAPAGEKRTMAGFKDTKVLWLK
jgi:hypothetical protein